MNDLIKHGKNLEQRIKQLEEVLWAKDQLLACYRLGGRRPTDKVMKILDKWDEQKALEGKDGSK